MSDISHRPTPQAVIRSCGLLEGIGEGASERLVQNSRLSLAAKGESIWFAGADSLFGAIVGTGYVKMTRSTPQGVDMAMEMLGPGQGFGIIAALEDRPFPLTATAVTACWYLRIPREEIKRLYAESVAFKDHIVSQIGPRIRRAHEMMSRLSAGRVEQRIAAVLFMLSESYGHAAEHGIELDVPLTRSDIAELAGTTTETAIRVLSRWQKQGLVSTEHQVITILDRENLQATLTI